MVQLAQAFEKIENKQNAHISKCENVDLLIGENVRFHNQSNNQLPIERQEANIILKRLSSK